MDAAPVWRRGDVGRRGFAFVIDLFLIMLLTQSLSALLFSPSGGTLIDSTSFVRHCRPASAVPAGVVVPPGFERAAGHLCSKQHLGYPTAHFYALTIKEPGSSTTTTLSFPLNHQWAAVSAFDLAALQLPLVALLRWLLERRGLASPGRRLLSLRVEPARGSDGMNLGDAALARRYALWALPSAVPVLVGLILLLLQRSGFGPEPGLVVTLASLAGLAPATAGIAAFVAIAGGRDAYYDAAAGTAVVRLVGGVREIAVDQAPQGTQLDGAVWRRAFRRPPPLASLVLAFVLIAVFVMEKNAAVSVGNGLAIPGNVIVAFGGKSAELVWQVGQWYRLVTAIFLHWNLAHLIGNLVPLLVIGWLVEPLVGARWLLATFLLGGLAGSLASIGGNPAFLVSAGASGAVFALITMGLVVSCRGVEAPRRMMLQAFSLALLISATTSGLIAGRIDHFDHAGGALAGVAIGLVILTLSGRHSAIPAFGGVAAGLAIALAGATFLSVPRSGFGDVAISRLLIPTAELPKTDAEWLTRAQDLGRRYPRDPRAHLALALAAGSDRAVRERELDLVAKTQAALSTADVPRITQNALAMVGEARRQANDLDSALDLLNRAIAVTRAAPASMFAARAQTNLALGRLDEALADRQEQVRLQPAAAGPLILLAGVRSAMGQEREASGLLDDALRLEPDNPFALRNRGWLAFRLTLPDQALLDLERSLALRPDPYTVLWLHIASVRSGRGPRLEPVGGQTDLAVWPGPIVRFYRGEIGDKEMRRIAEQADAIKRIEQVCETDFYLAQWYLMRNEPVGAEPFLRRSESLCPKTFHEWDFARAELRRASR